MLPSGPHRDHALTTPLHHLHDGCPLGKPGRPSDKGKLYGPPGGHANQDGIYAAQVGNPENPVFLFSSVHPFISKNSDGVGDQDAARRVQPLNAEAAPAVRRSIHPSYVSYNHREVRDWRVKPDDDRLLMNPQRPLTNCGIRKRPRSGRGNVSFDREEGIKIPSFEVFELYPRKWPTCKRVMRGSEEGFGATSFLP